MSVVGSLPGKKPCTHFCYVSPRRAWESMPVGSGCRRGGCSTSSNSTPKRCNPFARARRLKATFRPVRAKSAPTRSSWGRSSSRATRRLPPRPRRRKCCCPSSAGKPLPERPAVFVEPEHTAAVAKPQPKPTAEVPPEQPARPWLPLSFALFGLFASLGANVFLGWIAWDSRQRYRAKCSAK